MKYLASLIAGNSPKIKIPANSIANVVKGLYETGTLGQNGVEIPIHNAEGHPIKVPVTFA